MNYKQILFATLLAGAGTAATAQTTSTADIESYGDRNDNAITQSDGTAVGHEADITNGSTDGVSSGNMGAITQSGEDMSATIVTAEGSDDNMAAVTQSGGDNDATVDQRADGDEATVTQTGDDGIVRVQQSDNGNYPDRGDGAEGQQRHHDPGRPRQRDARPPDRRRQTFTSATSPATAIPSPTTSTRPRARAPARRPATTTNSSRPRPVTPARSR